MGRRLWDRLTELSKDGDVLDHRTQHQFLGGMVRVARRDHPDFVFDVADLRALPFEDASLAGVVC